MSSRELVAEYARRSGWTPAEALFADGYVRGDETLTVVCTPAGRVLHACHTVYYPDSNDVISRQALAGAEGRDLAITAIGSAICAVAA